MNRVVTDYARKNRFEMNGKKSGVMVFNVDSETRRRACARRWVLFGEQVKVVDEYVYLGTVTTNDPGSWTKHLLEAVAKAERTSADLLWIFRQDRGFRPRTAATLWQSMVRPVLEYASEIWAGQVPKYAMEAAERVQMSFLRGTLGLHANGSGVSDEAVRAETGSEPLASRWDKLQLGYWRRVFDAPRNRILRRLADFRHQERAAGGRLGQRGWIRAVEANLTKYGLKHYYDNPTHAAGMSGGNWKDLSYAAVDGFFDDRRAGVMAGQPSNAVYTAIKSWSRNTRRYSAFTGEVDRLGQYVPEAYLDDRKDLKGTRLKMLCRLNCIPVLNRVGREVRPRWPKESRVCMMCCMPEVEDVHHFVMGCPAYAHRRSKLLARISSCLEGTIDFDQLPDASKLHVLLGQRTGNPWAEGNVDRWVKVFLAKNWNQRSYVTETINMVLGATYSIYNTNF
jgi:hypothetical protein